MLEYVYPSLSRSSVPIRTQNSERAYYITHRPPMPTVRTRKNEMRRDHDNRLIRVPGRRAAG